MVYVCSLRNSKDTTSVAIPALGNSILCPIVALKTLLQLQPGVNNDPLFQIQRHSKWVPLTDSVARKHLKRLPLF